MSNDAADKLGGGVLIWVVLTVASLMIGAGIADSVGRHGNDHAGAIPAGVKELSSDTYLIRDIQETPVSEICGVHMASGAVESVERSKEFDGTMVVCADNQTWNDPHDVSDNYGHSLGWLSTQPEFFGPSGLLLAACLFPGAVLAGRDRRRRRERLKAESEAI